MVLYLAADEALEGIPETHPPAAFSVRTLVSREEAVRRHFSKPYVYFLGSHSGCSCGFSFGFGGDLENEGRESVRRLREYLEGAVHFAGTVELYACWDGDEAESPESRTVLDVAAFDAYAESFELEERAFALVARAA
jgi:hypothetical protein